MQVKTAACASAYYYVGYVRGLSTGQAERGGISIRTCGVMCCIKDSSHVQQWTMRAMRGRRIYFQKPFAHYRSSHVFFFFFFSEIYAPKDWCLRLPEFFFFLVNESLSRLYFSTFSHVNYCVYIQPWWWSPAREPIGIFIFVLRDAYFSQYILYYYCSYIIAWFVYHWRAVITQNF